MLQVCLSKLPKKIYGMGKLTHCTECNSYHQDLKKYIYIYIYIYTPITDIIGKSDPAKAQ